MYETCPKQKYQPIPNRLRTFINVYGHLALFNLQTEDH
jgi:hypothetical protein